MGGTTVREHLKMAVFWVVALCSLVEVYSVSEVIAASIIRAMSKPHLHTHRCENLKSYREHLLPFAKFAERAHL
jgi:hypothetical protein